jgi:hypothetical protein
VKPLARGMGALVLLAGGGCFHSAPSNDGNLDGAAGEILSGGCNNLSPGSTIVDATNSGGAAAPTAAGGSLAAGIYHLVSTIYYPDASCASGVASVATTLRVVTEAGSSGTLETLTATAAGDAVSESVRFTSIGSSLSLRLDCVIPDPSGLQGATAQLPYTATATELDLYRSAPTCSLAIDTYTRE